MAANTVRPTFTSLVASSTAAVITGYVPPLATGTTFIASSHHTIPTGTATASYTLTAFTSEPTTPSFADNVSYVFAYLVIHSLSMTSQRYTYFLWMMIAVACIVISLLHWTGMRGGYLGAVWSKWALRRRTWRKKHALTHAQRTGRGFKQPEALPSNAQILCMTLISIAVLGLCTIGPDYINPNIGVFQPTYNRDARNAQTQFPKAPINQNNQATTTVVRFVKRLGGSFDPSVIQRFFAPQYTISKTVWTSAARFGDFAFALLPLCVLFALKAPPFAVLALPFMAQIHFDKLVRLHRWTALLIWVLVAVHISLWSVQLAKDTRAATDKRVWAFVFEYDKFRYGWTAFIALTVINIISIRSFRQQHYEIFYLLHIILVPTILIFAAFHHPPVWWWCWIALGLWVCERAWRGVWWLYTNGFIDSVCGMRRGKRRKGAMQVPPSPSSLSDHEAMKYPLTASGDGKPRHGHSQDISRTSRDKRPLSADSNTTVGGPQSMVPWRTSDLPGKVEAWEMVDYKSPTSPTSAITEQEGLTMHYDELGRSRTPTSATRPDFGQSPTFTSYTHTLNQQQQQQQQHHHQQDRPSLSRQITPAQYTPSIVSNASRLRTSAIPEPYLPPPGYAHCVLLPGRTIRVRIVTPGVVSWSPGQHFLLNMPSITRATSHPFSVANVYDEQSPSAAGRAIVLLVRARSGWTKKLWERVSQMVSHGEVAPSNELLAMPIGWEQPPIGTGGVVLRAFVDGPFGSAVRARWGSFGTVLIVAGGSGVSFAMSILEYVCLCMAGRDGRYLGGNPGGWGDWRFRTNRVRFVWMVREYSHIQWCASAIRRCMSLLPDDALDVSIYVSNFKIPRESTYIASMDIEIDPLAPPNPHFAKQARRTSMLSVDSGDSTAGSDAESSDVDLSYYNGQGESGGDGYGVNNHNDPHDLGHESHILDYTNFDGEDDTAMPGENSLSRKLKKEGTLRRAKTRRAARGIIGKSQSGGHGVTQERGKNLSVQSTEGLLRPVSLTSFRPASYVSEDERTRTYNGSRGDFDSYTPTPARDTVENVFDASFKRGKQPTAGTFHLADFESPFSSRGPSTYDLREQPNLNRARDSFIVPGEAPGVMIDAQERKDLNTVSEAARSGKPKLDRILAHEIAHAKGPIIVGCCGPTSLNAIMRKVIASQIEPNRIRKGDNRSAIEFVSEDFEY